SYSNSFVASTYRLATGNDVPGRDFKSWQLYGKQGGSDWVLVDTVPDAAFGAPRQAYKSFELDVPGSYDASKMAVTATVTGADPEMSEIQVILPSTESVPATNYRRELDLDGSKASVSYTRDDVNFEREYFVSNPGNVMAIRLSASEPGHITQSFSIRPIDP